MKKLMIVDDEYYTRLALIKTIQWEDYGFEIVGEADNGKTALEKMDKLQPDLLLVDINMPIMNGLEFIKRIREQGLNTEVIILTGYNDFAYAKQAINYFVSEYLLKPIVEEELIEAVVKVAKKIDESALVDVQMEASLHVLRREFLNNLVIEKYKDEQVIANYLKNFSMRQEGYMRVITIECAKGSDVNIHNLTNIVNVLLPVELHHECWKISSYVIGIWMTSDRKVLLDNCEISKFAESLKRWLSNQMTVLGNIKIGAGKIVKDMTDTHVSYETSKVLKLDDDQKTIYLYEEEEGSSKILVSKVKEYVDQNLGNPELSINNIVSVMNFNYHYICKAFKKVMDISLGEYIISERMVLAKGLVTDGVDKVDEIARQCGYTDAGYFGKAFKKYYGMSPKQMMKNRN